MAAAPWRSAALVEAASAEPAVATPANAPQIKAVSKRRRSRPNQAMDNLPKFIALIVSTW
jgi:hypothetical protein